MLPQLLAGLVYFQHLGHHANVARQVDHEFPKHFEIVADDRLDCPFFYPLLQPLQVAQNDPEHSVLGLQISDLEGQLDHVCVARLHHLALLLAQLPQHQAIQGQHLLHPVLQKRSQHTTQHKSMHTWLNFLAELRVAEDEQITPMFAAGADVLEAFLEGHVLVLEQGLQLLGRCGAQGFVQQALEAFQQLLWQLHTLVQQLWLFLQSGCAIKYLKMADPSRRKTVKLLETLTQALSESGLERSLSYTATSDPWTDLQDLHGQLIALASTPKSQKSILLDKNNEQVVLESLRYFIQIYGGLSQFSKMLFEGSYSREIYRAYRQLYEKIGAASNSLYQFESENEDFLREKEDIITENLQLCQEIQAPGLETVSANSSTQNKMKRGESGQEASAELVNRLQMQIESLNKDLLAANQLIRQNDDEYALQIQRYNNTLFDMQETIREYEVRMDKVRELECALEELEHRLIRAKEQKYRDEMLIDNMSRKIRLYEKERGGSDVFLSPRASFTRKLLSPGGRVAASNASVLGSVAGGETRGM